MVGQLVPKKRCLFFNSDMVFIIIENTLYDCRADIKINIYYTSNYERSNLHVITRKLIRSQVKREILFVQAEA